MLNFKNERGEDEGIQFSSKPFMTQVLSESFGLSKSFLTRCILTCYTTSVILLGCHRGLNILGVMRSIKYISKQDICKMRE